MKHIIILGDGMADWPVKALGGKTLLQAAATPYMDKLACMGRVGRLVTVAEGFHPGSEVANMSVLGYNLPGQHGAADYAGVIAMTRPAHEKEYRNPLSELRAIGYDDLHIMRRARPKFINS